MGDSVVLSGISRLQLVYASIREGLKRTYTYQATGIYSVNIDSQIDRIVVFVSKDKTWENWFDMLPISPKPCQ